MALLRPFVLALLMSIGIDHTGEGAAPTSPKAPLAFTFEPADEAQAKAGKPPFFRVFPGGKDKKGNDASGTLGTLKLARGESKLYQEEDAKPGLIVLLRRVVFVPLENGDYQAILEGEFNAVKTVLAKATMDKLLAGERTDLVFASETTKGIRPVAFTIKAKTTFRAALRDGNLAFYGGSGSSTITHYAFTGTYTYESDTVDLGAVDNVDPVYIGRAAKPRMKGNQPETLPIIN